jgi:hypothetical protein
MQIIFVEIKRLLGESHWVASALVEIGGVSDVYSISVPRCFDQMPLKRER